MLDSTRLVSPRLLAALVTATAVLLGCSTSSPPEDVGSSSAAATVANNGGDVVTDGKFTNLYVYPHNFPGETWDQHLKTAPVAALLAGTPAQYSRASIDALTDRITQQPSVFGPSWPSYFGWLSQYSGVNPPQFFGSGEVSQSCYDAMAATNESGVIQPGAIQRLANCHDPGMAPSEEVNIIFSPELTIAYSHFTAINYQHTDMCIVPQSDTGKTVAAYHATNYFAPNFTAVPTSIECNPTSVFSSFSTNLTHEMVELLTDPGGLGYTNPFSSGEIADQCSSSGSPTTTWGQDVLAKYWSNHDYPPPGGSCQPSLDPPAGAKATTEVLPGILVGDSYDPNATYYPASDQVTFRPALSIAPTGSTNPANLVVNRLALVIQSGGVSGNFNNVTVDVAVDSNGGSPVHTNILAQAPFILDGETHSALLGFPAGIHAGDLTGITITVHLPVNQALPNKKPVARSWAIEKIALIISTAAGFTTLPVPPTTRTLMDDSDLPLVRFSGDVHDWQGYTKRFPIGAGDVPVQQLDLIISTGGDDLHGGPNPGDNCDVTLVYDNNIPAVTKYNVNQGQTWDGWTKHTVQLPVTNAEHLHAVKLHTGFVSSCCNNDNWNVERVQVVAQTDPAYDGLIVDTDGDGIADGIDNCPTVKNFGQDDTNYLAEYALEQRGGCADFPNNSCPAPHQVPSASIPPQDLPGFIDGFHKVFLGDVCDPATATQGGPNGVPFAAGLQGPCDEIRIPGGQTTSPPPASCPEQEDTQLVFQSWTGNSVGNAPTIDGQTTPFFCACLKGGNGDPDQEALDCNTYSPNGKPCVVAEDDAQPGYANANTAGWKPMTERVIPSSMLAPYRTALANIGSKFQEHVYGNPDYSTTHNWDFVSDLHWFGLQGTTSINGVLWSHVVPNSLGSNPSVGTMLACADRTSGTGCLLTDLNNHYFGMSGLLLNGPWFVGTPGPALVFHIGGWFDGGPGDPTGLPWLALPQGTNGMEVLRLVGTQPSVVTSRFSASALTMLAGVAAGTSDLLVGDDVSTGIRHATTPLAAVIVAHSTTAVQGGLRVGTGLAQGVSVSPVGVIVDPPDLRAYAAYDTMLYSLHVTTTNASLTALDVQAALNGTQSSTTVAVYGIVPVNPTALVWNGSNRTLYAIEQMAGPHGESRLRLLNLDPNTGESSLLWQTAPTYHMPTSTFLSVDAGGNLVLGMVGVHEDGKSEVVVLDRAGVPLDSGQIDGALVLPALAVSAGINAAVVDHSTLPVRAELLPRSDLEAGVCDAEWLREHADTKASPPDALGSAALACIEQHEGKQRKQNK